MLRIKFLKIVFIVAALFLMSGFLSFALASDTPEINFFYSKTCPHCMQEKQFLSQLQEDYPGVKINRYAVSDKEGLSLLKDFYERHGISQKAYGVVPATFVGDDYFIGFDEKVGMEIEKCISESSSNQSSEEKQKCKSKEGESDTVDLPLVGELNIRDYSLPALAVILGGLDGFNVCSLGALVLILGLVLALRERKKILVAGGVFVFVTAVIYGLLIVLWYQIFSFLSPYIRVLEVLIGTIGLLGGFYFIKEFYRFRKHGATCQPGAGSKIISTFSAKLRRAFQDSNNFLLAVFLILLFAGIVTIIEFPCSAAVPLMFAGLLAQANISGLVYLLYIALFVLFYLLDEIIVLLIAVFTLNLKIISDKSLQWVVLLEAFILILLGVYYLFGFSIV